ncbi:MAG: hypothetical protein IKP73_13930, partial [Bacteroidales bacterium]|nr:hypothetical protein [Bacteroidales bacterium]
KRLLVVIFILMATIAAAQEPTKNQKENAKTLKEAIALQSEGKLAESNQKLTDLYALHFMEDYVCWQLSNNYYRIGDIKKAERFANEAMGEGSKYVLQAGIVKALCLGIREKTDEELQLLERLAVSYPNEAKANPTMHLLIASLNADKHLYINSLLAYYMYLFANPVTYGKQTIIAIYDLMSRRDVNSVIEEKTANPSQLTKEDNDLIWGMLFINELKTSATDSESGLPDVNNFVNNSKSLITSICQSIEEKKGFYEEFYVNFYDKILKSNMLEVFLYYCLANAYPDINTAISGMSKEKMDAFADWLEENLE